MEHEKYDDEDYYPDGSGVHIGMFVAWAVDRGLHRNAEAFDDPELTEGFRARRITRAQLYAALDGKLCSSELNDEGNAFARRYYASGEYFADFVECCERGGVIEDSEAAWGRLCARLDARFRGEPPAPWWAFWRSGG